jgi:hypothetical protein
MMKDFRVRVVVNTLEQKVTVLATQDKWVKLKDTLAWLWENLSNPDGMDHKLLERKRGFLVHMVQTYPGLNPYLIGVHGSLDSWRKNRDVDGFRMHGDQNHSKWDRVAATKEEGDPVSKRQKPNGDKQTPKIPAHPKKHNWLKPGNDVGKKPAERPTPMFMDPEDPLSWEEKFGNFNMVRFGEDELTRPPALVRPVRRLRADVLAMMVLTSSEDAPHRSVRPGK